MTDKVDKLEQRINALEDKLRMTFIEVERRFDIVKEKYKDYDAEERIREIEDLMLLLQLEVTKIRDKTGVAIDIGITPETPPVTDRLSRLEYEISMISGKKAETPEMEEEQMFAEEKPIEKINEAKPARDDSLLADVNKILGLKPHV